MAETTTALAAPAPIEKHYKIKYLSDRLDLSYERVRQLVMTEPGVVVLPPNKPTIRRTRNTYLIPLSVVTRILRRFTNPATLLPLRAAA